MRRPERFVTMGYALVLLGCAASDHTGRVKDTSDTVEDVATVDADVADGVEDAEVADDVPDTEDAADAVDAVDAAEDATDTRVPPVCPWTDYATGLAGGEVTWAGMDSRAAGVLWAVARGLLTRSSDSGDTWEEWSARDAGFGQLGFPRDDPKALLSTSGSGLLTSSDGGVSFAVRSLNGFGLSSLMVHPTLPQRLFVGTYGGGIMRSDDRGDTWAALNVGVPLMDVRSFASPTDAVDVVVASGVLLNANLGLSNDGVLLYSSSGGHSWTVAKDGIGWADDVTFCTDEIAFAAVRNGIVRSDDGGISWSQMPAMAGLDVLHIAVAADCQTLYALVYTRGMYRSFDGGETAEGPFNDGLTLEPGRQNGKKVIVDPANASRVFVATYAGLFVSTDAAASWSLSNGGNGVPMHTMSVSAAAPERLLGSTWGSGAWVRGGSETPWTRVAPAEMPRDFVYGIHADPDDADRWFIDTTNELWRTTDGGETYVPVGLQTLNVFDMAFLASGTVLAATQVGGVRRSNDGGSTWTASNGALVPFATAAGTFIDTRELLLTEDGTLYLGTNGDGLYVSDDDGLTWTATAVQQGIDRVVALEAGPGAAPVLYAVVAQRGVVKSADGGSTWSAGSSGLESLDITDLVVDPVTGDVFISTSGDGVYRSSDGEHWAPFDRWCAPVSGFNTLAIIEDADHTWLVGARNPGSVWRDMLR